jgi:hypothetical protein
MPYESDYLISRNNATGSIGLKSRAWLLYKQDHPGGNLFEDFHDIHQQLLGAIRMLRNIEQMHLRAGVTLSRAMFGKEPYQVLSRAGDLADGLEDEAKMVVRAWHAWCNQSYSLTPMIRDAYTKEELGYKPIFSPGEDPESFRPFMNPTERRQDDAARAHRLALSMPE